MANYIDEYRRAYEYFRSCGYDRDTAADCAAMSAERACDQDPEGEDFGY